MAKREMQNRMESRQSGQLVTGIAFEIEALVREFRSAWQFLCFGDKWALGSGLGLLLSICLPWFSGGDHVVHVGLNAGGTLHVLLALCVLRIQLSVVQRRRKSTISYDSHLSEPWNMRTALWYLLIGMASTLAGVYLLFYFGSQYWVANHVIDIRFGFYVTLLFGVGISLGGLFRTRP